MGQNQSSNKKAGQRTIFVKNHRQRIDKETQTMLKTEYDRIQ